MRRFSPVLLVSAVALLAFAVQSGRSGDARPAVETSAALASNFAPADDEKPAAKKTRLRLPNNYGKLGLNQEQRQRIYAIQADYGKRIDELEAQLAALREKRDQECLGVLTPEQKQKLADILKEREKQKAARKKPAPEASASGKAAAP